MGLHAPHHVALYLVGLFVLAVCLWLRPRRRDHLAETQRLLALLKPGRLEQIAELGEADAVMEDEIFWTSSDRLRGVLSRLADLAVIVRILQIHTASDPAIRQASRKVWRMAYVQVWFSMLALPEALLCRLWRDIPHICARTAAASHVAASFRTQNLCITEDTPECIGNVF